MIWSWLKPVSTRRVMIKVNQWNEPVACWELCKR